MDLESIARKSISIIKEKYGKLPTSGFLAGGAISNIIWEIISGNKSVINDIDVFVNVGIINIDGLNGRKITYNSSKINNVVDYKGIYNVNSIGDFYIIESTKNYGIYNFIEYKSSKIDPMIILNSFDINCVQIGYSIENDKFYWTKDFEYFLETGNLKITNLNTPCQTAIRLFKKKEELSANLDELEHRIIQMSLVKKYKDVNKTKFSDKYLGLFEKYEDQLSKYFTIFKEELTEEFQKEMEMVGVNLYSLNPLGVFNYSYFDLDSSFINAISNSQHLLFYIRNIYKNEKLRSVYRITKCFFDEMKYLDVDPSERDLELISRLIQKVPMVSINMKGLNFSDQIKFINDLHNYYLDDPIIAISLIEKYKYDQIDINDSDQLLLQELTIRKEIVNDDGRSNYIFGKRDSVIEPLDDLNFL